MTQRISFEVEDELHDKLLLLYRFLGFKDKAKFFRFIVVFVVNGFFSQFQLTPKIHGYTGPERRNIGTIEDLLS